MPIPAGDLLVAFELFVVLILHADGAADVVDDVLVGSGTVTTRRLVAHAVRGFPVGIDVTAGEGGTSLRVLVEPVAQPPPAAACRGRRAVQIERRRWLLHHVVIRGDASLAIERGSLAYRGNGGDTAPSARDLGRGRAGFCGDGDATGRGLCRSPFPRSSRHLCSGLGLSAGL